VNLDPTSAYHLAQIAGMVLLYRAVSSGIKIGKTSQEVDNQARELPNRSPG
jgi:hypothetical protein